MSRVVMVVRTVFARVGVGVRFSLSVVPVRMLVLMHMFVRMDVRMLVRVRRLAVLMLVGVHMRVLMRMKVGVFVLSFHLGPPNYKFGRLLIM
jgi:hypothetical protein